MKGLVLNIILSHIRGKTIILKLLIFVILFNQRHQSLSVEYAKNKLNLNVASVLNCIIVVEIARKPIGLLIKNFVYDVI
jgi:hypothetical protein